MAKLKRLAQPSDDIVVIKEPISSEELLDRQLEYPLLNPRRFARRYNKLFDPIEFTYNGENHTLQFNYCTNPYCSWFGLSQNKYEEIKNKPSRYKLSSRGKDKDDTLVCNPDPTEQTKSHNCTVTHLSNWSVAEEIKRLATLDKVKDIEPEYNFHKDDCSNFEANPFDNPKEFYQRGESSGGSKKWQCKSCKKMTNVLPTRTGTESFTFNQKRNEIMPQFAKMLINRMPVTRTCEALDISPLTYYRKLEWLYRRCLEFLERHEQKPLEFMRFKSLWLNTDKLLYYLNNVRKKGHGGLRYDNLEDKQLQTQIIVTGDIDTGYIFRSDIAYDWDVSLKGVDEDTLYYREDHLHEFSKKNARLRFSHSPQPPTKNDTQTTSEYHEYRNEFLRRENYIDGLHVKSGYTVTAHLWLLKQTLQSQKWRFVSDEDETIINAIYRVFNEEFSSNKALHFLAKVDRDKDLPDAYQEHIQAKKHLKDWADWNGIKERSIWKIASIKLAMDLNKHSFHKVLSDGSLTYKVWAKNPIEHPLPPTDKGDFYVDCTTDLSSFNNEYIANMILKVSDHPTNNFMQQIRRRLSILERPLVTARGKGKSYIYANFNPKYAHMALTILRTYYNFCLSTKVSKKKSLTPAQKLGLVDKQFTLNDILYFK